MLTDFLNAPAGLALQAALVAAFLDFAFGTFAALRDGVFALDSVAAFLRKHVLGRVLPVGLLAVMSYLTGNVAMSVAAAAALTAYAAETMASIYASIRVPDTGPNTAIPTD